MRLGLFGGTFDPVHYGHLLLAETCREHGRLDRVLFMPAATSPHKQDHDHAPAAKRIEMLRLAIAGHDRFDVSTHEVDRGGLSYTVDTLRHLQEEHADSELFLLLGADSLVDLPSWREPEEICRLAAPVVVGRPGSPPPDFDILEPLVVEERLMEIRSNYVGMPLIGISSTDLRRRLAAGQSIRFQTPRAVEKYIETQGLYRGSW